MQVVDSDAINTPQRHPHYKKKIDNEIAWSHGQ